MPPYCVTETTDACGPRRDVIFEGGLTAYEFPAMVLSFREAGWCLTNCTGPLAHLVNDRLVYGVSVNFRRIAEEKNNEPQRS
jgi:hypothetical protein